MRYLLFLILIILISCNPIKRHNRIVERFPYVHVTDSIKLVDTIRLTTNKVQIDTVTLISALKDTITITEDNLTLKAYIVRDSFYLQGICDTIFIEKIITNTIPVYKSAKAPYNWIYINLFIALVIAIIIIKKVS
jgi:hypothetical protein